MATKSTRRADTLANRDEFDRNAIARGHAMRWQLGENATRPGHAYYFVGTCDHCAATMTVGSTWTSCGTIRDARSVDCSGPGTAILTEIEAGRASELFADALAEYRQAITELGSADAT